MKRKATAPPAAVGKAPIRQRTTVARPRVQPRIASSSVFQVSNRPTTEYKFFDFTLATAEFSTTGTISLINGITQGNDFNNIDGRKAILKSVAVHGQIAVGATPTASGTRWLLVYDKAPLGALPAITDILTAISMAGHVNISNSQRFIILADQYDYVEAAGRSAVPGNFFRKIGLPVSMKSNDGAIGNFVTGAIYLVTVGNLATGATAPTFNYRSRVRFIDG